MILKESGSKGSSKSGIESFVTPILDSFIPSDVIFQLWEGNGYGYGYGYGYGLIFWNRFLIEVVHERGNKFLLPVLIRNKYRTQTDVEVLLKVS